jgi:protease I
MLLAGFKVAILITNGFAQIEMISPRKILQEAGATVHIVSNEKEVIGVGL